MAEGKRTTPKKPRKGSREAPSTRKSASSRSAAAKGSAGKKGTPGGASRPRRLGIRLIKWSLICAIWGGVALGAVVAWYAWDLPDIDKLDSPKRQASITLTDSAGREIATYGDRYGDPLRMADVPPYLVQAIVATEDRRFFDHSGFDLVALVRAVIANVRAGRIRQGGSTLTQQLAKNIFLKPDRTLRRKVQELLLAFWLEANFSKEQIFISIIIKVFI